MKLSSQPSGLSLHFKKHKGTMEINGLQRHNERKPGEKHSNKRIKDERTKDNVMLKQLDGTYYQRINSIIEERRNGGSKGVRKDAVRMVEATVQLSGLVLEQGEQEQEAVLRDAYSWLAKTFGKEQIVSASIHKDETNMHLHFDFVPITKDKKLNAKSLLSQPALKRYQSDFLRYMQKKHVQLNFMRGDGKYNGLAQEAYEQLQKEREESETELDEWEKSLDEREGSINQQEKALRAEIQSYKTEIQKLSDEYDSMLHDVSRLQDSIIQYSEKEQNIKKSISVLERQKDSLSNQEKALGGTVERLKGEISHLKSERDKEAVKNEKWLKTQDMALETIEKLNTMLNKGIRLTGQQRREVHSVLKEYSPVTEENLQDLEAALENLQNNKGLSL